eukprot:SAG11_NODE_35464_length_266_cov_0.928144_1_plen_43_part_01
METAVLRLVAGGEEFSADGAHCRALVALQLKKNLKTVQDKALI